MTRAAVVTGAASGIGEATARVLSERGFAVAVVDRDEAGQAVAGDLPGAIFVRADVSDEDDCARIASESASAFGRIDVLVNNAARFIMKGLEATVDEWHDILAVNVIGPALVTKHVVPHIRAAGGGAIVNVASISSFVSQPKMLTYNTSKTAVLGITRCLAQELIADNIRVNAVAPSGVYTGVIRKMIAGSGGTKEQVSAGLAQSQLIPRIAEPREIATVIAFLASDDASYVTGTCVMADGGYTAL